MLKPSIAGKTVPIKHVAQCVFEWPGYDAEKALNASSTAVVEQITYHYEYTGQRIFPEQIGDLVEWMYDEGIEITSPPQLIGRANRRRWHGRYRVTLVQEGH